MIGNKVVALVAIPGYHPRFSIPHASGRDAHPDFAKHTGLVHKLAHRCRSIGPGPSAGPTAAVVEPSRSQGLGEAGMELGRGGGIDIVEDIRNINKRTK